MGAICTKPSTANVSNPAQYIPNSGSEAPLEGIQQAYLDEILYINTKYKDYFSIISRFH